MTFGKGGGIIDVAEEEKRGTVHHLRSILCKGLKQGTVKHVLALIGKPCYTFGELADHVFEKGISENGVRTLSDSIGISVCLLPQLFRALLHGGHLLTQGIELAVSL